MENKSLFLAVVKALLAFNESTADCFASDQIEINRDMA